MKPCATPGCPYPRIEGRRICHDCRRIRSAASQRAHYTPKVNSQRKWPPCEKCTLLAQCRDERLWVNGPLPCETLLEDEIGVEFEADSLPTLWVIPLPVRYGVEA